MVPGASGMGVTETVALEAGPDPQVLTATTLTSPAVSPKSTVIAVVPWPLATDAPAGTVQR